MQQTKCFAVNGLCGGVNRSRSSTAHIAREIPEPFGTKFSTVTWVRVLIADDEKGVATVLA